MGGLVLSPQASKRVSVFTGILDYFKSFLGGARSIAGSCFTSLPYLFNFGDYRREVTEQYPDPISSRTADDLPPRTRGLLYNDIDKCTGCKDCQECCPTSCIQVETEPGATPNKLWVAVFDIDFSRCVFCGLCVEACAPQSLVHTKRYEGAACARPEMTTSFGRGHVTPEQRAKWAQIREPGRDAGGEEVEPWRR
jgi:formate hydrogenlyase subunit 6/NADH:ubiquinone oxidoreductase subunit I